MHGKIELSSSAALCALVLHHAGETCDGKVLELLAGLSRGETEKAIQELKTAGLACETAENGALAPAEKVPVEALLALGRRGMASREKSAASALLFYLQGNYASFFDSALELLKTYGEEKKLRELFLAYEFFAGLIMKISVCRRERDFNFLFIEKCMKLQKISFKFPWASRYQELLFYKLRGVAVIVGDRRSMGYIDIHIGTLNITLKNRCDTLYYRRMEMGYRTIMSIGDRDIILRSADKILLYYIIESRFVEALAFFYSVAFQENEDTSFYINTSIFIYAASAATYMGNFHLAEHILEQGIEKILTLRNNRLAYDEADGISTMRAMIAFLLVWQNRYEDAIRIIDDVLTNHDLKVETYAGLWAARALAFYHYKSGSLKKSWYSFREWMAVPESSNQVHFNYFIATFVLDLLAEYQAAGYVFPEGWNYEQELEFAVESPFLILRANALRISGQQLAAKHDSACPEAGSEVEEMFRLSLELFRSISAPVDMAKTLIALAEFHLAAGKLAEAAREAGEAKRICAAFSPSLFPERLATLAEDSGGVDERVSMGALDMCSNFLRALKSNLLTDIDGNALSSMLGALLGTLGMMSGCVLHWRNGAFEKRACKMCGQGREEEDFFLFQMAEEACAVRHSLFRVLDEGGDGVMYERVTLMLHVRLEIYGSWLFYAEGPILRAIFARTEAAATGLEDIIAAWLTASRKKELSLAEAAVRVSAPSRPTEDKQEMVFASEVMRRIVRQVDTVACKDTAVLFLGESGCGKEVLAQQLHEKSGRSGNFICVNLSNLPYELFESECFGHEKGSFTGAQRQKIGLFELADNGTLFIDEIGDMPLPVQIKLLRVLQSKKFMRIGGTKSIYSNFRLVCATNRDLSRAVREGTFREDLYYRINVVTINIPPLRERKEDIIWLARHFLRYYAEHHNVAVPELTAEELSRLAEYSWPGNVRQLKNYMERFCILKDGLFEELTAAGALAPTSAPAVAPVPPEPLLNGTPSLKELEDAYFEKIYRMTGGEVGGGQGIAAILGISRSTAYAWITRLRLKERYRRELRRNEDFTE